MQLAPSSTRNEIAKRAYFYFLERRQQGLPDNPEEDWNKAEEDLCHALEPETPGQGQPERVPLGQIRGIGPRVTETLRECGVESADDLAHWTLENFGERLPRLTARARNGKWIEQARSLTCGQPDRTRSRS